MMRRILLVLVALAVLGVAGAYVWASRHPEIAAIEPPAAETFDPALVQQGEVLAAIGNCESCHTVPGRQQYAGGYSTATPFGIVYSTNITPHPATGIGLWSEEAFARALRRGIDREGDYLYPIFPYDHFTLVSDLDVSALYAYLMTRAPAEAVAQENELDFPYDTACFSPAGRRCTSTKGASSPTRSDPRLGTAAPTLSRDSAIAAPAIRRAASSAP